MDNGVQPLDCKMLAGSTYDCSVVGQPLHRS
jgi:hypothetical protein